MTVSLALQDFIANLLVLKPRLVLAYQGTSVRVVLKHRIPSYSTLPQYYTPVICKVHCTSRSLLFFLVVFCDCTDRSLRKNGVMHTLKHFTLSLHFSHSPCLQSKNELM